GGGWMPRRRWGGPARCFVGACRTKSGPALNGDCRIGVAVVLSTTYRVPAARAIAPTRARSVTFHKGFDGDSAHTSLVGGRTAFSTAARSVMSTNVVSMPQPA